MSLVRSQADAPPMDSPSSLLSFIRTKKSSQKPLLVGIDGPGGTGKTTLALHLQVLDPTITIVHMDDFDLPSNGKSMGDPLVKEIGADTDWQRLLREVVMPVREGKVASYRPFDREGGRMGREKSVAPQGTVIIEGVFSLRKELFSSIDVGIFLICSLQTRLERALKRDGLEMRGRWENDWIPMEERYMAEHKPQVYAHKVVDTEKALVML